VARVRGAAQAGAHVLIGALDEAATYAATAEDRRAARREVGEMVHALLDGLLNGR